MQGVVGFMLPRPKVRDLICHLCRGEVAVVLRAPACGVHQYTVIGRADISTEGLHEVKFHEGSFVSFNYVQGNEAPMTTNKFMINLKLHINYLQKMMN